MRRRSVLKGIVGSVPTMAGVFLPANALSATVQKKWNGRRVIMVELAGANDGLNTVVPYNHDDYHRLRPKLGLNQSDVLAFDHNYGLNLAMTELMATWENGDMAVVHGLGYPKPNRSHFSSIGLWETGGDGQRAGRQGWLTDAVQEGFPSIEVDVHGISFDGRMGIFSSGGGSWLSMTSASQFAGGSTSNVSACCEGGHSNPAILLVQQRTRLLERSRRSITEKLHGLQKNSRLGGNELASQFAHAMNLIAAGVNVPVMKVSLSGFDTHAYQLGRHANLLSQLSGALAAFRQELIDAGEWSNTLIVTYSEFGRRAAENLSGGTDHGTAAPHFVVGGGINGGYYGEHPDLNSLVNEDMVHTMDYRAVYQMILDRWLEVDDSHYTQYKDSRLINLLG